MYNGDVYYITSQCSYIAKCAENVRDDESNVTAIFICYEMGISLFWLVVVIKMGNFVINDMDKLNVTISRE
jgi:hypothetical protein